MIDLPTIPCPHAVIGFAAGFAILFLFIFAFLCRCNNVDGGEQ